MAQAHQRQTMMEAMQVAAAVQRTCSWRSKWRRWRALHLNATAAARKSLLTFWQRCAADTTVVALQVAHK